TFTANESGATETSNSVTFTPGPASSATSTIVASPTSVTANGTADSTLTVTVEDANHNLISGAAVTLSASGSDNTFTPISGTTNASGVFTATVSSTLAQIETFTANESGATETSNSVTFTPGPASSATSTIIVSPTSVTANGIADSTLTVTVEDANHNLIGGA